MSQRLTDDARDAFDRAGLSRRRFIQGSGALFVAFAWNAAVGRAGDALAQGINGRSSPRLDSWIAVAEDGTVTAYTGKCEFGQGLHTAQLQLVAEELGLPIARVRLVQCDTAVTPDQGTTSGQQSHPANFNHSNLALAAATAREALTRMASERLGVAAAGLVAEDGVIRATADASKRVTYAALLGGKRFDLALDERAQRKHPGTWKVLGTAVPRVDIPELATGHAEFVHTVRVPGMLHGRVVRPPTVGATLARCDESSVTSLPGVVKVVVRGNFVGVVAEKAWQAAQAATRLQVSWTPGPALARQADAYQDIRKAPARDTLLVDSGDVEATLGGAVAVLRSTYRHPYQMHGSVGSSCAVADVRADSATLWSATQSAYPTRDTTAALVGLQPDRVRVVYVRGSGCYGINGADTVTYDAALLSQQVGRPVRVQLSRGDEMAWENYGNLFVIDQRVGLDADGGIVGWDYEAWSAARGGRPGYATPGNVVTGFLAGFQPAPVAPRTPAPAPTTPLDNNLNTAPSYIAGRVGSSQQGAGVVRSERVLSHRVRSPFFTGPLRAPERLQNTFAHESFMDEVAAHVKADPVAYRLRHLNHPRLSEAVRTAAKTANWDARPSPRAGIARTGLARGRGIACVCYEGINGYVAMVAEVEVNQESGVVRVVRLVVGQDVGPISNPDGLRNQ
ncbi:MAG TPA: molybdopterin cofactor-binding domain-containing protein, partial [Vicinamibacterales bacterium]